MICHIYDTKVIFAAQYRTRIIHIYKPRKNNPTLHREKQRERESERKRKRKRKREREDLSQLRYRNLKIHSFIFFSTSQFSSQFHMRAHTHTHTTSAFSRHATYAMHDAQLLSCASSNFRNERHATPMLPTRKLPNVRYTSFGLRTKQLPPCTPRTTAMQLPSSTQFSRCVPRHFLVAHHATLALHAMQLSRCTPRNFRVVCIASHVMAVLHAT